jgi:hypothetical protein
MPNLMPDKGWRWHFEEPIPLPDEIDAGDSGRGRILV